MGYTTDYWGGIKLSSKEIVDKLEEFIKETEETLEEHFDLEGIELVALNIDINGYGKMYSEELEKFCLFIAKIDKKSYGKIECKGEEAGDLWRVSVYEGGVTIERGEVIYDEKGKPFNSKDMNKDIYKITKDKNLLRELIVEGLGD